MSTFNAAAAAGLALSSPDVFASAVLPNLTKAQAKEVQALVSAQALAKSRESLAKSLADGANVERVATLLAELAEILKSSGKHVPAKSDGGWSGYVVRMVSAYGGLKVTLTDPKG